LWFRRYPRGQTDTQTQTYSSQYFATASAGDVNIDDLKNSYTYELRYKTD